MLGLPVMSNNLLRHSSQTFLVKVPRLLGYSGCCLKQLEFTNLFKSLISERYLEDLPLSLCDRWEN